MSLILLVPLLTGCGGSLKTYGTQAGAPTRLDGKKATVAAVSVQQAIRLRPKAPVYVRGYLLAPYDDLTRLCSRLNDYADCRGAASIILDKGRINLNAKPTLHEGPGSTGLWSPRQVVVRLRFTTARRALLLG